MLQFGKHDKPTAYGSLLRAKRIAEDYSLREVADHIGISYVQLAEVERGKSGPLSRRHESKLLELLKSVVQQELDAARSENTPDVNAF